MTKYRYVGDGMGVPGLPHEISDEEAEALGVAEILKEAVRNGSYAPLSASQTSPQMREERANLGGEKKHNKKEITNG